jgi:hypothetical protein
MSAALALATVHRPGPAWYRGDFHCHTHHSDGVLAPAELAELARTEGLDFFAITDHNTTGAYPQFGGGAGRLIIPGIEATFAEGHFNVFGLEEPGEWLEQMVAGQPWRMVKLGPHFRTTTELMQAAMVRGWLVSINHPLLKPWEWRDGETDLRYVHCLEIWNDPSWPTNVEGNPNAVALWTSLLNAGYRLTGIGGSDYHIPAPRPNDPPGKAAERLGLPSTYVYAENLSGAAILDAVRARRVYVSMGPTAQFEARLNGSEYRMGDDAGEVSGEVELRGGVEGKEGNRETWPDEAGSARFGRVKEANEVRLARPGPAKHVDGIARIVRNGDTLSTAPLADSTATLHWTGAVNPAEPAWFRLEAWDENGQMLVITNPIFFGPRMERKQYTLGEFIK